MSLRERTRRSWRELKEGEPGQRFEERYRRRHERSGGRRALYVIAGVALLAAGIFFLPAPGPGTVILMLGAGLIAQESLHAARALDWAELRVRGGIDRGRALWRRAPLVARAAVVLVAAALAAALAWLAYRLVLGG